MTEVTVGIDVGDPDPEDARATEAERTRAAPAHGATLGRGFGRSRGSRATGFGGRRDEAARDEGGRERPPVHGLPPNCSSRN